MLDQSIETTVEKVSFEIDGIKLVGDLHKPVAGTDLAAVALIGPMTFHKEQAPTEYAKRLASLGFAALAFDPRYRGESGGEPRAWENPAHKVEDLKAAVDFLKSRNDVDPNVVSMLAICQGSSAALVAASEIEGLNALATIAGHYRDKAGDIAWLTEEGRMARMKAGAAAKAKFTETGEVDYVKGVDETDLNVGMPGAFVWEWYQPWADKGIWDNRYAVMSDDDLLAFESLSAAQKLSTPWLMIHGDNCFIPPAAHRHIGAVPASTATRTVWKDTPHLAFYDQPDAIESALGEIVPWFRDSRSVS